MRDRCTVARPTGQVFVEASGEYVPGTATTVYTGSVRVLPPVTVQTVAGSDEVVRHDARAWLPHYVTGVERGDVLTVTASLDDASLTGRTFTVVDVDARSENARRILYLEAATVTRAV
jgi:hypothetical protein